MARKSRRKESSVLNEQPVTGLTPGKEETKIPTGAYIRLSVEQDTDDTIETQIALVTDYIKEQADLELKEVYVDNGFTGTNFDRPDFQRLMTDCKTGKIQCVVVKDFSRFGRNFIESAYYIETFLSKIHVRFLSINDHFDSFREEDLRSIVTPLKLLVNEMYAKDTGKKIRKIMESKRLDGTQKIGETVFGYQVDRINNCFVVDPDAARTVKLIFHWYNHGKSASDIASALRVLQIPTPYVHSGRKPVEQCTRTQKDWDATKVKNILKKITYTGDRALGKRLKGKLPDESISCSIPEDEWIILKNTHTPLVSRSDFEKTRQRLKQEERKKYQEGEKSPFTGKVYCGLCGMPMTFGHYKNDYFYSDLKVRTSKGCGNKVHSDYLKVVVIDQIQHLIKTTIEQKQLLDQLRDDVSCKKMIMKCKRRFLYLQTKKEKVHSKLEQIFADHTDGLISDLDFQYIKEKYMGENRLLETEQEAICTQEKQQIRIMEDVEKYEQWLHPYLDDHRFNQELVNQLVDTITVYSTERIEIHFSCKDIFTDVSEWFEEVII